MTSIREATLILDPAYRVGPVSRRVFGSFVEHLGRCVYTGVYEPGHPTADDDGLRGDVLDLIRELGVTRRALPRRQLRLRLPVGGRHRAREQRPVRLDLAWQADRDQRVRPDEFMRVGRAGRRRADDGGQPGHPRRRRRPPTCWSTATTPAAPRWSDLRARPTARAEPYGIGLWCLGNEMDGPWQIGHKTADEVRPARRRDRQGDADRRPEHRAGRLRQLEPAHADVRRRGRRPCSSTPTTTSTTSRCTPTTSAGRRPRQLPRLRGRTWTRSSTAWSPPPTTCGRRLRHRKRIQLSFDEWNVWYTDSLRRAAPWPQAPRLMRGPLQRHRRRRGRQPADLACSGTRPGRRRPARRSWSTSSRRSAPSRADRPGGRRSSTRSPTPPRTRRARCCGSAATRRATTPRSTATCPLLTRVATHDEDGRSPCFAVNRDRGRGAAARRSTCAPSPASRGPSGSSWRTRTGRHQHG